MENCVFCARSQFEEKIIAETHDFFIVASLGQITDGGHTLLVPKEHIPCMGALDLFLVNSVAAMAIKIFKALSVKFNFNPFSKYPVTAFEHGIVGQSVKHAHLHFLPVVLDLTTKILTDFPGCVKEGVSNYSFLRNSFKDRSEPYLFWTTQDGQGKILWNPPAPAQYLRTITAEMLGCPERGNWRDVNPELDKKLWEKTVTRLKPYFYP